MGCKIKKLISATREYKSWEGMIQRCTNRKYPSWKNYGGRGISVCARWRKFSNFLSDMGPRPERMSLGRIDNDGPYAPGNCRWETPAQQSRNSRHAISVTIDGETLCLKDWALRHGLRPNTVVLRVLRGWTVEKALRTPKQKKSRYGNQFGYTYDPAALV